MRRVGISIILLAFFSFLPFSASAILSMELTQGITGAIPIAIVPFNKADTAMPEDVDKVITNDLQMSGRFKIYGRNESSKLQNNPRDFSKDYFKRLGTDHVVVGSVKALGNNRYEVAYQLLDMERVVLNYKYTVNEQGLRTLAHHISDAIYQQLTGTRGIFSTKIAYVVVNASPKGRQHTLEVSDHDGFNPRPLLKSPEPIMSPAWSPNGKQLAYVSFENRKAGIYLQDVNTGARRLLSQFPGINGAPSWSPDGQKLALVLSKGGSPNIYVMDINSHVMTQITHDTFINTEPAWSTNGKSLLYTSNRSGAPQIYQVDINNGSVNRISYDGDYNARASYTRDGKNVAMIHRVAGFYNIAVLDLNAGTTRVLTTSSRDSASPSVAPNGSMILYDTVYRGRNVLAMVSADGKVQLVLPDRNGQAQDPAWSPFLS
ncbi:MAG: Tol-Pal system beta propeller repeat protein TolB [Gammaproteobacteria bacterium]|nr:Tol-Pal system beta propeller repeat protein TolB [Gammaproteobacteria bacterium]